MSQLRRFFVAVAATALITSIPAAAVIKIAKYTGTVSGGYDYTGMFGAANTDLTGARYVATYTYDKTLGYAQATDGATYDISQSFLYYTFPEGSPVIAATIKINGVTQSMSGPFGSKISTYISGAVEHDATLSYSNGDYWTHNSISNFNYAAGAPGSLDKNFGPVRAMGGGGSTMWILTKIGTGPDIYRAYANFGSDAVYSVRDPSISGAIPEPASWATMIAGFVIAGTALRRRRARLAV